jgi:hypothetical protein
MATPAKHCAADAVEGQFSMHNPHFMHFSWSILKGSSLNPVIASTGHALAHIPQLMQLSGIML